MNLSIHEVMKGPKVLELTNETKLMNKIGNDVGIVPCDANVAILKEVEDNGIATNAIKEYGLVCRRGYKTKMAELIGEMFKYD